jgi:hypothetical protein
MSTAEDLSVALDGMRSALQADGYDLIVSSEDDATVISVTAGPDACAECLVPKEVMLGMIRSVAPGFSEQIDLRYPVDTHRP